jgi:hypothetical protein
MAMQAFSAEMSIYKTSNQYRGPTNWPMAAGSRVVAQQICDSDCLDQCDFDCVTACDDPSTMGVCLSQCRANCKRECCPPPCPTSCGPCSQTCTDCHGNATTRPC